MRVFNTLYENRDELLNFIDKNSIKDSKEIFVQVFTGIVDEIYIQNLINELKEFIPNVKILGSTTDGEIYGDSITTKKTVLSFSLFDRTIVTTYSGEGDSPKNIASNLSSKIDFNNNIKLMITFANGIGFNGEEYIKYFEGLSDDLTIAGGLAGDNAEFKVTYTFTESGCFDNGSVCAIFSNPDLIVNSDYNFGWENIGKDLKITKSKGNVVYTIDNKPAKQIYKHYLGDAVADRLPASGVEFPIIINRNGINIARAVLDYGEDGSLIFSSNINEGEIVQFGYGNPDSILSNQIGLYKNINNSPIEAMFIYSCMSRRRFIGGEISKEIIPLNDMLELSGFFTYGEFFHNKKTDKNELLNETMTILTISENVSSIKVLKSDISQKHSDNLYFIKALSHLASVTSKELKSQNSTLEDRVKLQNIELHYNLYHDNLTNLNNKNALIKDMGEEDFSFLMIIDIDNFRTFIDLYEIEGGNSIIKGFAKLLNQNVDEKRYDIYRFHNDQFILRDTKGFDREFDYDTEINKVITDIQSLKLKISDIEDEIDIDITVGIVFEKEHAIEKSIMALNHAKKYKKLYQIYNKTIDSIEKSKDDNFWNKEIKKALKNDNIIAVYQPIVNSQQDILKYEALMRIVDINDDKEKLISPFFFLDVAVKTKQYSKLTEIMVEKSFSTMKRFKSRFSINISFEDILNSETMKMLKDKVIEHNVGKLLIIEIVESENIDDYDKAKRFINNFRELGIKIAIDDFGAGFSNYLHVLELDPDYLKLDGSLIKNIDKSEKSYQLVKSIVGLTKSLGIKTVAEFVHSDKVFEVCKELDIDEFQGFYFSEPVKEELIEKELSTV